MLPVRNRLLDQQQSVVAGLLGMIATFVCTRNRKVRGAKVMPKTNKMMKTNYSNCPDRFHLVAAGSVTAGSDAESFAVAASASPWLQNWLVPLIDYTTTLKRRKKKYIKRLNGNRFQTVHAQYRLINFNWYVSELFPPFPDKPDGLD